MGSKISLSDSESSGYLHLYHHLWQKVGNLPEPKNVTPPQLAGKSFKAIRKLLNIADSEETENEYTHTPTTIESVLKTSFESQRKFEKSLFAALKTDLEAIGVRFQESAEKYLVLEHNHLQCEMSNYAFGFARQAKNQDEDEDEEARRCDHVCCIFEKESDGWQVKGVFSAVGLTLRNRSSDCGRYWLIDQHEPDVILKEINYVFRYIWPSICRFGLADKDIEPLRFALIAADRKNHSDENYRWVQGRLITPIKLKDAFRAQRYGCQKFPEKKVGKVESNEDDSGPNNAANLYVEMMLRGIEFSKKCCQKMKGGKEPFPSPLAGFLDPDKFDFCGSPLLSANELERYQNGNGKKYFINQGELYYCKQLNLSGGEGWLVDAPIVNDVFLKIWSRAAHKSLQDQDNYYSAYRDICKDASDQLKAALSIDFIGMERFDSGTTATLMQVIEGDAIELQKKGDISSYWKFFKTLCFNILLPLAEIGVNHQDLRPGYDYTANIMLGTTKTDPNRKMRLIDYESLCRASDLSTRLGPRYPNNCLIPEREGSAYDVLFQQCVGIAYAWKEQVITNDFEFVNALGWFGDKLESHSTTPKQTSKKEIAIRWWKDLSPVEPVLGWDCLLGPQEERKRYKQEYNGAKKVFAENFRIAFEKLFEQIDQLLEIADESEDIEEAQMPTKKQKFEEEQEYHFCQE